MTGGHATFLDIMAEYGLFCGGVFLFTRILILLEILRLVPQRYKGCYRIVSIIYIALGFLNTTNDMIIPLILFMAIPYLFIISGNQAEEHS